MIVAFVLADVLLQHFVLRGRKSPIQEALAYVVDSLFGGMTHVFCIEAIVTEFIHYDFVSWEVVCDIIGIHAQICRKTRKKIVDSEKES